MTFIGLVILIDWPLYYRFNFIWKKSSAQRLILYGKFKYSTAINSINLNN